MIKLSLNLPDISKPWRYHAGRWQSGESWIEPVAHPLIEHGAFSNGSVVCIVVRERCTSQVPFASQAHPALLPDQAYQEMLMQFRTWPLDVLTVELDSSGLTLRAGPVPLAPVYLATQGHTLSASWDLSDLRLFMRPDALVDREVARQLSGLGRYGHETLFAGIYHFTAGSTATFSATGLRLAYPLPVAQPRPRQLTPGADLVSAFEGLLHDALDLHHLDPGRTAVQLSGGQDSAMVAMSLGAMFPHRVTSCAMMLAGAVGEQQARRRRILAAAAQLAADVQIPALDNLPLHPAGPRVSQWCSYREEPYIELQAALIEALRAHGIHTIVTGFGGDELMLPDTSHRAATQARAWLRERVHQWVPAYNEDISPATAVPETALMALAATAPANLRAGMWPIAPLVRRSLTWFAKCLPLTWRADKYLMRQRLTRLGLAREIVYPALRENFSDIMGHGLHRFGAPLLRRFASNSYLVSGGYIDPEELRRVADQIEANFEAAVAHSAVFAVLAVELSLQRLA